MKHDDFKADLYGMVDMNQKRVDRPLSTTAAALNACKAGSMQTRKLDQCMQHVL